MANEPWILTRQMFLAEAEVDRLLGHLGVQFADARDDARDAAFADELIIQSLLYSGLRNSEFCQLRMVDTVIGIGKSVFEVRGTPRQDRTVFVPQSLSALVRRYVGEVRPKPAESKGSRLDRNQPLILNEHGRPYERTGLYRRVVRILTEAGFRAGQRSAPAAHLRLSGLQADRR